MKPLFFKTVFLILIIGVVSFIIGSMSTKACDEKIYIISIHQKQIKKRCVETKANYSTEFPDFILTNSILRF